MFQSLSSIQYPVSSIQYPVSSIKYVSIIQTFPKFDFLIFAPASLIRPAPVELPQDRKVARVDG